MPRAITVTTFGEKGFGNVTLMPMTAWDADALSAAICSEELDALLHRPTDMGGRPADLEPARIAARLAGGEGRRHVAQIRDSQLRVALGQLATACAEPRLTAVARFEYLPGTNPTLLD